MPTAQKEYVRLPGSGQKRDGTIFFGRARIRCTLWLGRDHLLAVDTEYRIFETYKRFYFNDIQAIILRKTRTATIVNCILGMVVGLLGWWAAVVQDTGGRIALLIIAGVFGLILLLNLLYGSTCTCHLKTAVQLEEMPSLRRLRRARKVIDRIRALIEEAQGTIAPEVMAAQLAARQPSYSTAAEAPSAPPPASAAFVKPYQSRVHFILFLILVGHALISTLEIFVSSSLVIMLGMLASAGIAGGVVLALIKQKDTDLRPPVRVLTWVTTVYAGLNWLTGFILLIALTAGSQASGNYYEFVRLLAERKPFETPWLLTILILNVSLSGLLGALGLALLKSHWGKQQEVPAAPPMPEPPQPP